MDRLKTFAMYALWIVAFFIFSTVVSNILLENSYTDLKSNVNVSKSEDGINVETNEVKSNKAQGFYNGKVTNTSDKTIPRKYMRIRSYSNGDLLETKYIKIEDLKPGKTKDFSARFTVGEIDSYDVDYVDEMPDDRTFLDKKFDEIKEFINADDKVENIKEDWNFNFGSGVLAALAMTYIIFIF